MKNGVSWWLQATKAKMMAHFTPLGWMNWECVETAKRHPFRGVPYIPAAVMLPPGL